MFFKLLEFGMGFDWITPVLAQIQDIAYGPRRILMIGSGSGWSGHRIGQMLTDHGVKNWGMMIVKGDLLVSVKKKQLKWAEYLLQREGIPLLNPVYGGQQVIGAEWRPPAAESKPAAGLLGFIAKLDRFIGG